MTNMIARVSRSVVSNLGKVTAPVLYFRSRTDHVVDGLSEIIIAEQISSTDLEIVYLEDSYHVATLDNDLPAIIRGSLEFLARLTALEPA